MNRTSIIGTVVICALLHALFGATTTVYAAGNSRVSIRIVDERGKVTPARVWIQTGGTRLFIPSAPDTATVYARDRSFSCDGLFSMEIPAGNAVFHIEKGKEYIPVDYKIRVEACKTIEETIQLKRWINMPSEGWYSADLHVHLGQDNPRILRQLALADDVHLVPAFTYWLRGRGETWSPQWPAGIDNKPTIIDQTHIITRNNIEIERIAQTAAPGASIGATFLFNLNRPVTAEQYGEHFPTDSALCRAAQIHSPDVVLDSDKPSWAETVIGAALDALDTIQVCHNHYHRDATLPGGWGMIGPLGAGESNFAVNDGLFHRTDSLYYRFLNCGFRLSVSGGSAIGVMPVPTGYHRVYAKINGAFTANKLWEAIKEGRSFATTGPMLTIDAGGQTMGATISRSWTENKQIKIVTTVRSIEALESLQIIHNGRVVASLNLLKDKPSPVLQRELMHELLPQRSGWVAARAIFRAPDGLLRQAHTSPIYVSVENKPIAFVEDAEYMLRWIEVLTDIAQSQPDRFPTTAAQEDLLATYGEARVKYEQIVNDAKRHWGD